VPDWPYPVHQWHLKEGDPSCRMRLAYMSRTTISAAFHEALRVSKEATIDRPHTLKEMAKITAGMVTSLVMVGWMAAIAIAVLSILMR
jgi:hypothetical protein